MFNMLAWKIGRSSALIAMCPFLWVISSGLHEFSAGSPVVTQNKITPIQMRFIQTLPDTWQDPSDKNVETHLGLSSSKTIIMGEAFIGVLRA